MVNYVYDAWGNHKVLNASGEEITAANHIGNLNPFRYRGYYYDVETGLYYLQSRYYDPEIGRFMTIDSIEYADSNSINGLNLYAYCGNNPVKYKDKIGNEPTPSVEVTFWTVYSLEGSVWSSGRYVPTRQFNPYGSFGENLLYAGETFLSNFELTFENVSVDLFSITNSEIKLISMNASLYEGKMYWDEKGYVAATVGSASLTISGGTEDIVNLEAKATALTVGAYSEHLDAELLVGSIGGTFKVGKNGITFGLSFGIGFEFSIRW